MSGQPQDKPVGEMRRREMLSPQDVANELGRAKSTVIRWLELRFLPGQRVGSRWYVKRTELEAWKRGETR